MVSCCFVGECFFQSKQMRRKSGVSFKATSWSEWVRPKPFLQSFWYKRYIRDVLQGDSGTKLQLCDLSRPKRIAFRLFFAIHQTLMMMSLRLVLLLLAISSAIAFQIPPRGRNGLTKTPTTQLSVKVGKNYEPKWKKKKTLADDAGDLSPQDKGIIGDITVIFKQGNETRTTLAMPGQPVSFVAAQVCCLGGHQSAHLTLLKMFTYCKLCRVPLCKRRLASTSSMGAKRVNVVHAKLSAMANGFVPVRHRYRNWQKAVNMSLH
jgi:hypothetical protein